MVCVMLIWKFERRANMLHYRRLSIVELEHAQKFYDELGLPYTTPPNSEILDLLETYCRDNDIQITKSTLIELNLHFADN